MQSKMYAIIKVLGRQYRVSPDEKIEVARIKANPGSLVTAEDVMLVNDGENVEIGAPTLPYKVNMEIVKHDKRPKVVTAMFKRRGGMRRTKGHRQPFTVVKVKSIEREG